MSGSHGKIVIQIIDTITPLKIIIRDIPAVCSEWLGALRSRIFTMSDCLGSQRVQRFSNAKRKRSLVNVTRNQSESKVTETKFRNPKCRRSNNFQCGPDVFFNNPQTVCSWSAMFVWSGEILRDFHSAIWMLVSEIGSCVVLSCEPGNRITFAFFLGWIMTSDPCRDLNVHVFTILDNVSLCSSLESQSFRNHYHLSLFLLWFCFSSVVKFVLFDDLLILNPKKSVLLSLKIGSAWLDSFMNKLIRNNFLYLWSVWY